MIEVSVRRKGLRTERTKQVHIVATQMKMWQGGATKEQHDYRAATFLNKRIMIGSACYVFSIMWLNEMKDHNLSF